MLHRARRFGPESKRPSNKTLRLVKAKKGLKRFTPPQVRALIRKAGVLRCMILLVISCGCGNADCGTLPPSALDRTGG